MGFPEVRRFVATLHCGSLLPHSKTGMAAALCALPYPYVENDLRKGRLHSALEDWSTVETTLYAVYPSRQHLAPKIRVFLNFLVEEFSRS